MDTNCVPLVADLFMFCYERDFIMSPSEDTEAFSSTSRYLDHLLNVDNKYFDDLINQIYSTELQLNKVYFSEIEAPFLDLHLSILDGFISYKIYDKRLDFDFEIVNFLTWMGIFLVEHPTVFISRD